MLLCTNPAEQYVIECKLISSDLCCTPKLLRRKRFDGFRGRIKSSSSESDHEQPRVGSPGELGLCLASSDDRRNRIQQCESGGASLCSAGDWRTWEPTTPSSGSSSIRRTCAAGSTNNPACPLLELAVDSTTPTVADSSWWGEQCGTESVVRRKFEFARIAAARHVRALPVGLPPTTVRADRVRAKRSSLHQSVWITIVQQCCGTTTSSCCCCCCSTRNRSR